MNNTVDNFQKILLKIEENDTNYEVRYPLVFQAIVHALELGLKAGIRIDPKESEWPVAYIELPNAQISWHMPQHSENYDGHNTAEKYASIHRYINWANHES